MNDLFLALKLIHVSCAIVSIGGFAVRGYWAISADPRLRKPAARMLPHLVDTMLLLSALAMLWLWGLSPFSTSWLSAKLVALLLYIFLGMVTLRFAGTRRGRCTAYFAALFTAAYIVSVALAHSPWGAASWLVR